MNDEDKTLDRELRESHAWCQNRGYEWSAQVQQRAMAEIDRLRAENERLQTRSAIVDAINALREEEGQAVNIPNANPDWGGPAQVITVYTDFTDDNGKEFTSDPGIHGMDESLLNCLQKASKALAAAQAAKAQFQNQGGKP